MVVSLTALSSPSMGAGFKESVITGYKNRCIEVRTSKGQNKDMIKAICDCESLVLNNNFNTFEFLLAGAKKKMDKPMFSKEKLQEFKKKLKSCAK